MERTATASATVELPTTSATAACVNVGNEKGDWVCFDNSMDDATSNANIASVGNKSNTELATSSNNSNTTGNSNSSNNNTSKTHTEPTTSSTAYSFTGSALGSGSIANLNANAIMDSVDGKPELSTNSCGNNSTSGTSSSNTDTKEEDNNKMDDSLYECNICLDTAKDAVVSMCGHLFCWPCLHQWLETRPSHKLCPVCKAAVDKDKVIPLYGRNSVNQEDPRNKVPPRPAGQRTEPEPPQGFPGFGFGDGFHMSFGIGAFPFGFFTSSLNFGEPRPPAANRGTTQYEDEQTLSKLFLYLAFMCIAWLLFA